MSAPRIPHEPALGPAAFELVGDPGAGGPFVFTCEHASRELPEWQPEPADLPLLEAHWGWDIGAGALTRALAAQSGSCAVLCRFSRLVCDPNRTPEQESFVVREVDGRALSFNRGVDAAERARRRRRYFDAYHAGVDLTLQRRCASGPPPRLCSIHSFTPVYLGRGRPMEVGVLFDAHAEHAWRLEGALAEQGFEVALNAPYSGYEGLIYSASRHGRAHDLVYLELEVRQDLIDAPARVRDVALRIGRALEAFAPPGASA